MTNRLVQRTKKMSENIENELVELLDKPLELFEKLLDIHWNSNGKSLNDEQSRKETKQIVVDLNHTHKADICSLAVKAVNAGFDANYVKYLVQDAIPFLTLDLDTLIKLLLIANRIRGQTVKDLVIEQPTLLKPLLTKMIDLADPAIAFFIPLIINAQPNKSINQKHQALFSLLDSNKIPLIKAALHGLTDLSYDTSADHVLFKQTVDTLDDFIAEGHKELVESAIWSLCRLLSIGDKIKTKVLNLAQLQNNVYSSQIIDFIFNNTKYIDNSEWFEALLMSFAVAPCESDEIRQNIDFILQILFSRSETQMLAERFWMDWLTINPAQIYNNELKALFSCTLATLVDKTDVLMPLVTRYINHDNEIVVHTAFEVIDYIRSYRKTKIALDQSTLQSFTLEELLYVCRKILGYVYNADVLQNLFYSILTAIIKQNQAIQLVSSIFVTYIAKEYPESTLKFLKDKRKTDEDPKELSEIVTQLITKIEYSIAPRTELQQLQELTISNQQHHQIQLAQQKYMNQLMEKEPEGSITSLFSKMYLKYGKGSFNRYGGHYSQPSTMSSHSHSMQIPTSESYQPVHAALHRINFRQAKKGRR